MKAKRGTVPAGTPLDALWQPRVLLWVFIAGEGLSLLLALAPGAGADRWAYFGVSSFFIQWSALLALAALYVIRRRATRLAPYTIGWLALLLLVAASLTVAFAARALLGHSWLDADGGSWPRTALRVIAMATTVGLLGLAAFQNHWQARKAAVRLKQAELESLQARIQPHFLFNTLNTAAALVHQQPEQVERLLLDLSDLFRAALAGPHEIALSDEIALTRRYLEIEALRFGERLRVSWDLPPEIPKIQVPALSIQPLVENAIRHGVERIQRGGRVEIAMTTTRDHVLVMVRNPLVLGDTAHRSHKVGLSASQARIEAATNGLGRVETSVQGEHFLATIRLPRPRDAGRRTGPVFR